MTEIRRVDAQPQSTQAQNAQEQQSQTQERKEPVFKNPSVWDMTKSFFRGFGEYYQDKYAGTAGIGDALCRTQGIINEGAEGIDECTLEKAKTPIREWSRGVADKLDDGDDSHLSMKERLWAGTQGVGNFADKIVSAKTAAVAGEVILGATAVAAVLPETAVAGVGVALNAVGTVAGIGLAAKGTYDIATAETKEQAQNGGTELASGATMLIGAASTAKQAHQAAYGTGLTTVNPEEVSTVGSMVENVKTTGRLIGKIPTGNNHGFVDLGLFGYNPRQAQIVEQKANVMLQKYKAEGYTVYDGKIISPNGEIIDSVATDIETEAINAHLIENLPKASKAEIANCGYFQRTAQKPVVADIKEIMIDDPSFIH